MQRAQPMTDIRTFVAVLLEPKVRSSLIELSTQMAQTLPAGVVRWSSQHQLHLTLRFLGKTSEEIIPEIGEAMVQASGSTGRFEVALGDLGFFPNRRRPNVIWVGMLDPDGGLSGLRERLDLSLLTLGWPAEKRPFRPHLTLGRVRGSLRVPDAAIWKQSPLAATIPVESVHLMKSTLKPAGAEYTELHRVDL
jgi:2'-5' RNA ligase